MINYANDIWIVLQKLFLMNDLEKITYIIIHR